MAKKTSRSIFVVSVIVVLAICIIAIIGYYLSREGKSLREALLGLKNVEKIEASFQDNPSLRSALYLTEKYILLEDFEKAIHYGELAIKLGANDTEMGVYVNLWMAEVYNRTGKIDKALKHLQIALSLDEDNIIQEKNYIDKAHLRNILEKSKGRDDTSKKEKDMGTEGVKSSSRCAKKDK